MYIGWSALLVVGILGLVAAAASGAVGRLLAGWEAAQFAWTIALPLAAVLVLTTGAALSQQWRSSRFSILARALVAVAICSTLFALGLPVFFLAPVWSGAGAVIGVAMVGAWLANGLLAHRHFLSQWVVRGPGATRSSVVGDHIDLDRLRRHLQLDPPSIFQFRPMALCLAINAMLLGSMLLGLNLRSSAPLLSAMAWGVPSLIFASWLAQPLVMAHHELRIVNRLERERGRPLAAAHAR